MVIHTSLREEYCRKSPALLASAILPATAPCGEGLSFQSTVWTVQLLGTPAGLSIHVNHITNFPPGLRKSLLLYNLHRAVKVIGCRIVVIVEGFFDCVKVHQAGYRCVVALMGSTLSSQQLHLLATAFRRCNSHAGRRRSWPSCDHRPRGPTGRAIAAENCQRAVRTATRSDDRWGNLRAPR
jgi:hypothetical protein